MKKLINIAVFQLLVFSHYARAQSLPDSTMRKVDRLFEKWRTDDQPGCVAGIVQEDKLVYAKGFGLSNLEYKTPNTPGSIYYMCSLSKQFAGYALALLVGQGKVNVEEDIHVYLPWLPDFGQKIRVRHLIHHTSGIRDDIGLARIAGSNSDLLTQPAALQLLQQQRSLNFSPGEKFAYSNSNYVLIAEIVKAVSGQSFPAYTTTAIFQPLGMSDTRFVDDPSAVIPNRAASYTQEKDSTLRNAWQNVYTLGDGGLFTNVNDMAKWISNFYTPKAGTQADITRLTSKGQLDNGKVINYAMGINADTYRGQRRFTHNGGLAGYRTIIAVYPDLHLGFMVFGNAGDGEVYNKIDQLSSLFIPAIAAKGVAATAVSPAPEKKEIDTVQLKKWTGNYISDNGYKVNITLQNGHLMVDNRLPLDATSAAQFYMAARTAVKYQFHTDADKSIHLSLVSPVLDKPMQLIKANEPPLTAALLATYTGAYYSSELDCSFHITAKNNQLWISDNKHGTEKIILFSADHLFTGFDFLPHLLISRDAKNTITGFDLNSGDIMHLHFRKIKAMDTFQD